VCPFNKFSNDTTVSDFDIRHNLDTESLTVLFEWTEEEFKDRMAGSPINRIGHERWIRNIAVALGNAPSDTTVLTALNKRANDPSELIREHVAWAINEHQQRAQ